jgi:hypothetical protein
VRTSTPDRHASLVGVVETGHELGNRRLAAPRPTDEGDRLAGADHEIEAGEHRRAAAVLAGQGVGKAHRLEAHFAPARGHRTRPRRIGDDRGEREDLVHALGRGHGASGQGGHVPDIGQGGDEHGHVRTRRHERAHGQLVLDHETAAVVEDAREPERREELDKSSETRPQPHRHDRPPQHVGGSLCHTGCHDPLGTETLHRADTADGLLRRARELPEDALQRHRRRVHPQGEGPHEKAEDDERPERQEGERPVREDEDDGHADGDDRARHGEGAYRHEVGHLLEVRGGPGHELTRLGLVVEGEMQPLHVGEEAVT